MCKMQNVSFQEKLNPVFAPIIFTFLIVLIFHPGFMSYDTLHALRSAREGVTDSMWPPMVSYVWRVVDWIYPHPSLMFFLQILLLLVSISYLAYFLIGNFIFSVVFLLFYLSVPVVLGTVIVIWKDVLMASFFLASFALLARYDLFEKNKINFSGFIGIYFLIFLGVCVRHNAIFGAIPLFFFYSYFLIGKNNRGKISSLLLVLALTIFFSASAFLGKSVLDSYSLPEFTKLNNNTEIFVRAVRVLDIAGASVCRGENLFGELLPGISVDEIHAGYNPKHINLSKKILEQIPIDERVDRVWLQVAIKHPLCFFYNKFQITKHMVGAGEKGQFAITHPSIDNNNYGYKLDRSLIREAIVDYIISASKIFIVKPWFIYTLTVIFFFFLAIKRKLSITLLTLFPSGAFYFMSLVIFGNAADARLPFYTTTVFFLILITSLFKFFRGKK